MLKTQLPFPKQPLRPEAPFFTIQIHKKTIAALQVGVAGILGTALALHGRAEIPAAATTQEFATTGARESADRLSISGSRSASPGPKDGWTSLASNASFTEDKRGANQPSQTVENEVRPVDVQPLDVRPLEIKSLEIKSVDVSPIAPPNQPEPAQVAAEANIPSPPDMDGSKSADLPSSPSDAPDSTPIRRPNMGPADLNAAGATIPALMYQKWFNEFHKTHPEIGIHYQPIGSGGGIAQLQKGVVDFGASDGPMNDEQLAQTPFKVLHFPTVVGAVVLIYNIPEVNADLKFTPDVIADIYLGKIKKWDDPRLAKANPGIKLPSSDICPVHRSDGSGTTYIFTDYLSKVSQDWADGPKKATAVNWPVGLGGKGSDGVAGTVKQTPGSIGYVELIYTLANNMPYGMVQNAAGNFVKASLQSVTAAAASVKIPDDLRASITNAPGINAYPISSFTWLLVPVEWTDPTKESDFIELLSWMVGRGQTMTSDLQYAPLPASVQAKVRARIREIRVRSDKPANK